MNKLPSSRLIAASAVAVPALLLARYIHNVYAATAPVPWRSITEVRNMPDTLRDSATVSTLINPKGHTSLDDSRFIDVPLPKSATHLKDEAILAALLRGFFGGHVFAPERVLLRLAGMELTNYTSRQSQYPVEDKC
jgi:hypothetical protein